MKNYDSGRIKENPLSLYLKEINRIPCLSPKEQLELGKRIQEGDEEARNKLITGNLRYVVSVAKKYQEKGLPLLDLINEGNIGLMNAAERYDYERGFHFITYAKWWIRQAIIRGLHEKSRTIKLSIRQEQNLSRAEKLGEKGYSIEEIADMLNTSVENIEYCRTMTDVRSLDSSMMNHKGEISEDTRLETIPDERYSPEMMANPLKDKVNDLLDCLNDRSADVLKLRYGLSEEHYGEELTLEEVGTMKGLTRERVRQIQEKALEKLRTKLEEKL
jgi:RNA polymerase primary sigma factor